MVMVKSNWFKTDLQLKTAGSNVIFAAITEISDSVLKGAEASGFNGMVNNLSIQVHMLCILFFLAICLLI